MTDINKQIEEEARAYRDREFQERIVRANSNFDSVDIEMAFRNGYKSCLHSSRWRKVSEELPESNKEVLVKVNMQGYVHFDVDRIVYGEWMNGDNGITEWKRID